MMSLNYDLSEIEDWENRCRVPRDDGTLSHVLSGITEALIFATMTIDLGEITQKNHIEFYTRMMMYKFINPNIYKSITLDDVIAHIGLTTNVMNTTPLKFNKKLGLMARDRIGWDIDCEQREADKALEVNDVV